ncbi:MAG: helix-turn-helix transcriptional regulator [Parvularculaceae bacterium]|nr:helix-turn-helix transcriptional regulator [Parvularculaceae bacterium]
MKNRLRELREGAAMTQSELASLADVSRQTIIAVEKSHFDPSLRLAYRLSDILKRPVEEIFPRPGADADS